MVSTRSRAQTGGRGSRQDEPALEPEQDVAQTKAKKKTAVRKAGVKSSKPDPAPTATTKPSTTRSKTSRPEEVRAQPPADPKLKPDLEPELLETTAKPVAAPPPSKATTRTTGRLKRGAPAEDDDLEASAALDTTASRPAKASKSAPAKARKPTAKEESIAEAPSFHPPSPEVAKPTRRTRAALSKPQPLSPKKVSQVARPKAQDTKPGGLKPGAKSQAAKPATRGRAAGRKRTVSDENADVAQYASSVEAQDGVLDEMVAEPSQATATAASRRKAATQKEPVRKQALKKARLQQEQTDTGRPGEAASIHDADSGHDQDQPDDSVASSTATGKVSEADSGASDDELCGPKTPMKRASPTAHARYLASVQGSVKRLNDSLRTPVRRANLFGETHHITQTQRPRQKLVSPGSSEQRPMTVARAADRAFVFKDLRQGRPEVPQEVNDQREEEEQQEGMMVDDEPSFIPDDNVLGDAAEPEIEGEIDSEDIPARFLRTYATVDSMHEEGAAALTSVHDATLNHGEKPQNTLEVDEKPDETMVTEDEDQNEQQASTAIPVESFDTEDTVLITRNFEDEEEPRQESIEGDIESNEGSVIVNALLDETTPEPETMVWENLRQDRTIAIDFDEHLSNVRTLPLPEPTERLSLKGDLLTQQLDESCSGDAIETNGLLDAGIVDSTQETESVDVGLSSSRRETVNFDEFIDEVVFSESREDLTLSLPNVPDGEAQSLDSPPADPDNLDLTPMNTEPLEDATSEPQASSAEYNDAGVTDNDGEATASDEDQVPHYAFSTLAFDFRRISLPAIGTHTPAGPRLRPATSEGYSMPRLANPLPVWPPRSRRGSLANTHELQSTPSRPASSAAVQALPSSKAAPPPSPSISTDVVETAVTPDERRPRLPPRQNYEEHAQTAMVPKRFTTPTKSLGQRRETVHRISHGEVLSKAADGETDTVAASPSRTAVETPVPSVDTRRPRLPPREDYEEHAQTIAAPKRFETPIQSSKRRRETVHPAVQSEQALNTTESESQAPPSPSPSDQHVEPSAEPPPTTPTERFPRLQPRQNYEQHAKTVAGPLRFRTPAKTPSIRKPTTTQKPPSLRKAAMMTSASRQSHTPVKTPLKPPASSTPGQQVVPMTPHPAAPLRGVVALVEVFTLEGASASAPFSALLHRLGGKTARSFTDRVTHVIFKDGSPTTLQRVRLHNKDAAAAAPVHCVNSRWLSDCDAAGARMPEAADAYAVDVTDVPRGGKRRRKSMEPSALLNLNGNVVREPGASLGRSRTSLARCSSPAAAGASPAKRPAVGENTFTPPSPARDGGWEATDASSSAGGEMEREGGTGRSPAMVPRGSRIQGHARSGVDEMESADEGEEEEEEREGAAMGSPATPAWIAAPDQLVQQTAPMLRVRKLELKGRGRKETKNRRITCWNGGGEV